ncbi:MAG TPA: choice-of-anchor A family protein [Flavipsychrobacter sp.]|nr:choice-of-anchor A family protein [Flavipsychrobacter sp.]
MKKLQTTLLSFALATGVYAQSPTAPALNFNVFLENNFSTYNSETEGPIAMGGNMKLQANNYVITNHRNAYLQNGKYLSLVVGGQLEFNGGALQINDNGYAKIASSSGIRVHYRDNNNASSPLRITPGTTAYSHYPNVSFSANYSNVSGTSSDTVGTVNNPVIGTTSINFGTAFTTMRATSTSISTCSNNADLRTANNVTLPYPYTIPGNGQVKIQLNSGVNVLNLTGSQLNQITNFTFNNQPSASNILVVNVNAPGSFTWNAYTNGGFGGLTECQYILYNFYNTTALTIGSNSAAIEGTVFAPFADIDKQNYSNLEGQVIAKSYSSVGGENHYAIFQPSYAGCSVPCTTPAPASFTTSSSTTYQGQVNVTYKVPTIANTTYSWSYSGTGATINGTGDSVSITFSTTATSGNLSVKATNGSCTQSTALTLPITVKPYITWLCTNSNSWSVGANWDAGFAPYGTISVLIPSSSCQPTVSANTAVNNIKVENGATVNINCSTAIDIKGNFNIQGSILGCGNVTMTGSTQQTISGNGTVSNLELNNTNGATITPGDTLHISSYYKPTNGVLTTNGGLELLSGPNKTATIGPSTICNYIVGNVIVNKYIPGNRRAFRFFAHPFSAAIGLDQLTPYIDITGNGGAANGFTPTVTNNPSAFWYNTATGNGSSVNDSTGWIPFTNTNGQGANAWNPMQGARILVRGSKGEGLASCCNYTPSPVTIKMNGPVNQCNTVFTATTNANMGYNFVGNPYASNVDMSQVTIGAAINANFSVWDPNQGVAGAYVSQPFAYQYILPAYSSFIVRAASVGNKAITFSEASKANLTPASLFKTTNSFGNDVVQLRITTDSGATSWDRVLLFFNNQATDNADALMDAEKMSNPNLDFYTYAADSKKLAVDVRPFSQQTIQLGLETDLQQTYTINVEDLDITTGGTVYLHDKYLNTNTLLAQHTTYDFTVTSDPLSQGDRFELNAVPSTTSVQDVNNGAISSNLYPNPATSEINLSFKAGQQARTSVQILSITGQQLFTQYLGTVKEGNMNIAVANLPNGLYFATIKCGNHTITKRFVKQ